MPARKRTAEAHRRQREALGRALTLEHLARVETDPVRLRVIQEEAMWAEREPCANGRHCSCDYCCGCGEWTDPPDVEYVLPWDAVVVRAREVLGPPPPSPRVWARLLEP